MPATSFEMDHEVYALLGRIPEAIRAAEKEISKLERHVQQVAKKGGEIDEPTLRRIAENRSAVESYRNARDREKEIRQTANNEIKKVFGGNKFDPISSAEKATELERARKGINILGRLDGEVKREQDGIFKFARKWLNTHNPHGSFQTLLSGNFNFNSVTSFGSRLGMTSGVGAGLATFTAFMFNQGQKEQERRIEAQKITLQTNSERWSLARASRFNSSAEKTEFLTNLSREARTGNSSGLTVLQKFFRGGDEDINASITAFKQRGALILSEVARNMTREQKSEFLNVDKAVLDPAVQRKFTLVERGLGGWLYDRTIDRFTGHHREEELKAAMDLRTKQLREMERRKQTDAKVFYEQNPASLVSAADASNQQAAFRAWRLERFTDWNTF